MFSLPGPAYAQFSGQFKLEIDDVELGRFMECKGLVVELEIGEPELDRDSAALLLGQTVGVGAGEGLDQRTLPVIDVSRRPEYEVPQAQSPAP